MSLTRNEWIEMWASVELIEINSHAYKGAAKYCPPSVRKTVNDVFKANNRAIKKIKNQIQSVIGQMK